MPWGCLCAHGHQTKQLKGEKTSQTVNLKLNTVQRNGGKKENGEEEEEEKKKRQSNRRKKKKPPGYLVKLKCGRNHSPLKMWSNQCLTTENGSTNKGKARSEWVETFSPAVHGRHSQARKKLEEKTLSAKLPSFPGCTRLPGSSLASCLACSNSPSQKPWVFIVII